MIFEQMVKKAIIKECKKHISRYHNYLNWLTDYIYRENKNFNICIVKQIKTPIYWGVEKLTNPFYTLRRVDQIAHSISKKIIKHEYQPNPPIKKEIPKPSGGKRILSIFQIPDAAISRLFFDFLMHKNSYKFSSYSYAYRNDKTTHYAVENIFNNIISHDRIFIAEYDFSKFFDKISHKFIINALESNKFFISNTEMHVIKSFLSTQQSNVGVPQGTSISLFLANAACSSLDKSLESAGINFARYADDTILWSNKYEKICEGAEIISEFSKKSAIPLNIDKSEGISLLVKETAKPQELSKTKTSISYLGYPITPQHIGLNEKIIVRIKKKISYIIYKHLIQPIKHNTICNRNVTIFDDKDVVVTLQEIRRYIYGDLSEKKKIQEFLFGGTAQIHSKGLLSNFPLIDDVEQLKSLDGWMANSLMRALRRRYTLLNMQHIFKYKKSTVFIKDYEKNKNKGYCIPSFRLLYNALKKGIKLNGLHFNGFYNS